MTPKYRLADLELHILNTRNPQFHQIELVENAFTFWQKSWQEAFAKLNVGTGKILYSDDFLDREAIALFHGSRPVGLIFTSIFTMRSSQLGHSYFHNYPDEVIVKMKKLNIRRLMALSYVNCDPDYRRKYTDMPMSDLLFSLGVLKFQSVPHEYMLGYIRKDLNFYEVFKNHGGVVFHSGQAYNVDVDYLYMTKETMKLSAVPGVAELAIKLWEKATCPQRILQVA